MTLPMNEVMQNSEKEEEISLIMKWNKEFQKKYSSSLTKPEEFELFNEFLSFNVSESVTEASSSVNLLYQAFDDTIIPISQVSGKESISGSVDAVINVKDTMEALELKNSVNQPLSSLSTVESTCLIDHIKWSDFNISYFQSHYLSLNHPVAIELPMSSSLDQYIDEKYLLNEFGDLRVVLSKIPYGNLFGKSEKVMTLKEYFFYMKQWSHEVRLSLSFVVRPYSLQLVFHIFFFFRLFYLLFCCCLVMMILLSFLV
jgi:hypothetical protein